MAMCIKSVEGLGHISSEEIRRLSTRDRSFIMATTSEMSPGIDLRVEVECDECGCEWAPPVDLNRFFRSGNAETQKTTKSGKKLRRPRRRT